jgi:hypothetical protein
MEPDKKKDIYSSKKIFDKKYKNKFVDDDKIIKKAQKKQFKQRKQQMFDNDTLEELEQYDDDHYN